MELPTFMIVALALVGAIILLWILAVAVTLIWFIVTDDPDDMP